MSGQRTIIRSVSQKMEVVSRLRSHVHLPVLKVARRVLMLLLFVPLSACFEEETAAVSYSARNQTDKGIESIIVNGEGGVLGAYPQKSGTGICCVVLPRKWRPGLTARIKWRNEGAYEFDSHGKMVTNDGVPVLIEAPWNERTIELPQYDDRVGQFQLHFYSNGDVKSVVSNHFPGHPNYPEPK